MVSNLTRGDPRAPHEIRAHYELEKELAHRLRTAPAHERGRLYSTLYNELYRRVPYLRARRSPDEDERSLRIQLSVLRRYLKRDQVFLELGPGNCALSVAVAPMVERVWAVDVSDAAVSTLQLPENVKFVITDGSSVPVPANSVHVAYSNQMIEHLHPDDALDHLRNTRNALVRGGIYICVTPNRLSGPHDVSRYFDEVATGFHLKEYTIGELAALFRQVGFSKVRCLIGWRDLPYVSVPSSGLIICERLLCCLPRALSRPASRSFLRLVSTIRLVGLA